MPADSTVRGRAGLTALLTAFGLLLSATAAHAVPTTFSYAGAPLPIPDGTSAPTRATIPVAGLQPAITDVDFRIDGTECSSTPGSTTVGIDHTFVADLVIGLTSPGGTTVRLIVRTGASGNNFCQVLLDDDAGAPPIQGANSASAPFTGTWSPNSPLSAFDGEDPNGNWVVSAQDVAFADTGTMRAASVIIDSAPAASNPVLEDGPAGYWRFGEPSGTTLNDSSPNLNHGTYQGGVTLGTPGVLADDTAATFDGVDDFGRVPNSASLSVGNTFTAEGWIRRAGAAKSVTMMVKGFQLLVMSAANNNEVWLRKTNVSTITRSTVGVPADGAYHHVAVTKDGSVPGAVKMYIDGAAVATADVSPLQVIQDNTSILGFGAGASNAADFDEFALYDAVLGAGDIADHHAFATEG